MAYTCGAQKVDATRCGNDVTGLVGTACRVYDAPRPVPLDARPRIHAPGLGPPPDVAALGGGAAARKRVWVTCSDGHTCEYDCQTQGQGTPVPVDEVKRWTAWRDHVDPPKAIERLNTYATWVWGTTTAVATVATGLGIAGVMNVRSWVAATVIAFAVLALCVALIASAASLAPQWVTVNPNSPEDLERAFGEQFTARRHYLGTATRYLAGALALASAVPLVSAIEVRKPRPPAATRLSYVWKDGPALEAHYVAKGLRPRTAVGLDADGLADSAGARFHIVGARGITDDSGHVDLSLAISAKLVGTEVFQRAKYVTLTGCIIGPQHSAGHACVVSR